MGKRRLQVGVVAVLALLVSVLATGASAQAGWSCDGRAATIVGTPGADNLRGTAGADVIVAREGNDVIDGLGGDDIICAGKGDDRIFGGGGFDVIFGAQGNDTIHAASGATAATRSDTKGARMFGGAGNDTIHGSNKWDRMQGGPGKDALYGYEGRDWMRAGSGIDAVDGGPGVDDLHGGNGNDLIEVTAGDIVKGGAGLDQCNLAGAPGQLRSCGRNEREQPAKTGTAFSYTHFTGDTWTGELYGLVDVPFSQFVKVPQGSRCLLLVGEFTPRKVGDGIVSNGFNSPPLGVLVGGEYIEARTQCDASSAEALGYQWVLRAKATPGTTIPVFAHIYIPATKTGQITEMIVGDPQFGGKFESFPALTLPTIPTPRNQAVGPPITGRPLDGNATFEYVDFAGGEWTGRVLSVEPTTLGRFNNRAGRCFLVLGELTPTLIPDGLVSSGFSTPNVGVLANGRYITDDIGCDATSAEAQGFGWILDAEVTQGSTYKFYSHIFIPEINQGRVAQVVVGNETDDPDVFTVG